MVWWLCICLFLVDHTLVIVVYELDASVGGVRRFEVLGFRFGVWITYSLVGTVGPLATFLLLKKKKIEIVLSTLLSSGHQTITLKLVLLDKNSCNLLDNLDLLNALI